MEDGLVSIATGFVGGLAVALTNQLFTYRKTRAERVKIESEHEIGPAEAGLKRAQTRLFNVQAAELEQRVDATSLLRPSDHQVPAGWYVTGQETDRYRVAMDKEIVSRGGHSVRIESIHPIAEAGFITVAQVISAEKFRASRLKLESLIKTEQVVKGAGLWIRADDSDGEVVAFDNMTGRRVGPHQNWTVGHIAIDIPNEADVLLFGLLLSGSGRCWFDQLTFEVVSKEVSLTAAPINEGWTATRPKRRVEPVNLTFGA